MKDDLLSLKSLINTKECESCDRYKNYYINNIKLLGWPNLVRQSAAVGLLKIDDKLRPTHMGSKELCSEVPIPSF
ncbi:MAG: hypothetical protein QXX38_01745 [Candidatus Aenigmatarchaeota archaeon]